MKEIHFPENIKNLRSAANMSQSRLASLLNVDQRTISAWENGICEPSFTMLAKLCDIFDEDFNGLLA